jgi:hypothetical protein
MTVSGHRIMARTPDVPSGNQGSDPCALIEDETRALLDGLGKVPGMTLDQAARFLGTGEEAAARVLRKFIRQGVVQRRRFQLRRVDVEPGPLFTSRGVGASHVQASEIASLIRDRYGEASSESVYSLGPFRRPHQVDHEISVTAVYLWYRSNRPEWTWLAESPRRGARVPDATVVSPEGEQVAIDFAGEYRGGKIADISFFYASRGAAFELW